MRLASFHVPSFLGSILCAVAAEALAEARDRGRYSREGFKTLGAHSKSEQETPHAAPRNDDTGASLFFCVTDSKQGCGRMDIHIPAMV